MLIRTAFLTTLRASTGAPATATNSPSRPAHVALTVNFRNSRREGSYSMITPPEHKVCPDWQVRTARYKFKYVSEIARPYHGNLQAAAAVLEDLQPSEYQLCSH